MNSELLKKLKENTCTESELYEIYRWLCAPDKGEEATAFLKNSWQEVSFAATSQDDITSISRIRKEIWDKISNDTEQSSGRLGTLSLKKPKPSAFRGWMKVAAVMLLLICTGIIFWYIDSTTVHITDQVASKTVIEKTNPRGQKSTLFLRDGSKVILNSSSSVKYSNDFGETNRDIELIGEAFFEVAKNERLPFNVVSGDIITTALGTSFNIQAYPAQKEVQVSLVTGKTRISFNETKSADSFVNFLDPGQSLTYDSHNRVFVKDSFNPKEVLSWKDGILYFENKEFSEAKRMLEEWYDVDIKVDYGNTDELMHRGIKGEFRNQSLESILKVMNHARDFDYEIKGKKISIRFR